MHVYVLCSAVHVYNCSIICSKRNDDISNRTRENICKSQGIALWIIYLDMNFAHSVRDRVLLLHSTTLVFGLVNIFFSACVINTLLKNDFVVPQRISLRVKLHHCATQLKLRRFPSVSSHLCNIRLRHIFIVRAIAKCYQNATLMFYLPLAMDIVNQQH